VNEVTGSYIELAQNRVGPSYPVYVVAEMSANHGQDFEQAVQILHAAREAGADAIKLQTYTPDTITIDVNSELFRRKEGLWAGRNLYDLYREAHMPWEWQPRLKEVADCLGLTLFSTPFDRTAVDFLEKVDVPAYKIASFEIVDIPLIKYVASKGKPVILSTGMATLAEIGEAVEAIRSAGAPQMALLRCASAYPAPPQEMNLRVIPYLAEEFGVPVGLSDHTLGIAAAVTAVALGACIVEKHFTLSRKIPGPDSAFSLEPQEFREMVTAVRTAEKALGEVSFEVGEQESASLVFRRSLFVVEDIRAGDMFTENNVRSIRPGYGLHPRYLNEVLGRRAAQDIEKGTPLGWEVVA
jgi:pseudaminic acid synthase